MEEQVKIKKNKVKFVDRTFFVLIAAFFIICVGQPLGNIIYNALSSLGDAIFPGFASTPAWRILSLYLPFIGIWIVGVGLLAITPSGRTINKSLWNGLKGNTVKMLVIGLALGLVMNLVCAFAAMLNGDIALRYDSFKPISFLIIFVFVFVQSAAEEFICRGYIFQKLIKRYNKPVLAGVINAAFFSFIHLANPGVTPMSLLNIFLYGLLFSALVIYLDSIWVAMAAHATWNFCQNIILGLPNSGMVSPYSVFKLDAAAATDSFAYSVSFGLEGTITACLVLIVATVLIYLYGTKKGIKPTDIWANN